jgi:hypothetical protein
MVNVKLSDFKFFRMWPRDRFRKKDKKGRLLIKHLVTDLQCPGVYVLYNGDEIYYVGKAMNNLFGRLHSHSNIVADEYYAHWDYFSAFALVGNVVKRREELAFLEAVLIAAMPRATNRSTPRFPRVKIPKSLSSDT